MAAAGKVVRSALLPSDGVRPLDESGAWRSEAVTASFRLPQALPAGWIRVRFAFRCDVPLRLEVHAEHGCLNRSLPTRWLNQDLLLRLERPVAFLRIDVIGAAARFHLTDVRVGAVSSLVVLARGLTGKLALLRKYGNPWSALGRGLRLLLQGRLRAFVGKLHKGLSGPVFEAAAGSAAEQAYDAWRRQRVLGPGERAAQGALAERAGAPLLSVVLCGSGDEAQVRTALLSVRAQTYGRWECWVADTPEVVRRMAEEDPRIRIGEETPHPRPLSPEGRGEEGQFQGEFVVLLDAQDELAEHALFCLAQAVLEDPNLDLVIADEDRIDPAGRHHAPFFKPGWSPETLLEQPALGAPLAVRTSLLRDLGGLRDCCAAAAAYDLVLRVASRTSRVRHIADVLVHRRADPSASEEAGQAAWVRALRDHLEETGRLADLEAMPDRPAPRVRFRILGRPLVSIVIPTAFARSKEGRVLALECVCGIRTLSTWEHHEILVVASRALPADVSAELARWGVTIVPSGQPFNFAAAINRGAAHARGDQLLLLNDDTEVITPDWLESLLEYAQQPDIGAVGARLLFPHGRIQHAGVHLPGGRPLHAWYGYPADHPGHHGSLTVPSNVAAVTGACLMTRHDLFRELGGLDERFPLDGNDIDYCLRVRQTGRRVVCTPYAQLLHHEAFTRRGTDTAGLAALRARWGGQLEDPYYNPNLSQTERV